MSARFTVRASVAKLESWAKESTGAIKEKSPATRESSKFLNILRRTLMVISEFD
jgi:hypothetical protein